MNKTSKSLAAGLLATGLTIAAFGQGTINFDTFNANTAKGGVYLPNTTTGVGSAYDGQLFYSDTSSANPIANFTAFSTVFAFSSGNNAIIDPSLVVDPNQAGGNHVFVQLRVWNASAGNSWATAVGASPLPLPGTGSATLTAFGNSSVMTLTLGGDDGLGQGDPPFTPGVANNFTSFALTPVPEPSTIVLGGLGAAALLAFRRRNK